ncbi:translation initiation factor IF-2-like [Sphaerodactylus townsendi]|uniref:translation initiation factor IF-2-like n=1 Tax=Sphaerodactylus townsendi TaxID=933632 RepID=UPI00202629F7|nr:translation initiation factor IF-2-like [Sphaerodactylus townsendi]
MKFQAVAVILLISLLCLEVKGQWPDFSMCRFLPPCPRNELAAQSPTEGLAAMQSAQGGATEPKKGSRQSGVLQLRASPYFDAQPSFPCLHRDLLPLFVEMAHWQVQKFPIDKIPIDKIPIDEISKIPGISGIPIDEIKNIFSPQRKRRALPLPAGELPAPPQPGQLPAAPQPGQLPAAPQPGQLPAAPQPGQFPAQQPFLKNFGGSKFGKKLRDGSKFGKKFCRCPESKPVTEAPAPAEQQQIHAEPEN